MTDRRAFLLGTTALFAFRAWGADRGPLLVLYPDAEEPERSVYRLIRDSVASTAQSLGSRTVEVSLDSHLSSEELTARIERERPSALIALGRAALDLAQQVARALPLRAGAVELPVTSHGSFGGLSLVVSPQRVLATLAELAPGVRRVVYVLDPQRFGWLRPFVDQAAHNQHMQAVPYEAATLGEAAGQYLNILRYGNPATDALWLLEAGQFVTDDTLPRIVEESWTREFMVFSNVLGHVSKGVLFAHYPDPVRIGQRLANSAVREARVTQVIFDEEPKRAINVRVARHLASTVHLNRAADFDLTVGEP
jgi:putative ABC transport system substrate-binding protein